jgi:ribosomal protein S7
MQDISKYLQLESQYSKKFSYLFLNILAEQLVLREKVVSLNINSVLMASSSGQLQPVFIALVVNNKSNCLINPVNFLINDSRYAFVNNSTKHSHFETFLVFLYSQFLSKEENLKYNFYTLLSHKDALYKLQAMLEKKNPFSIYLSRFLTLFFSSYVPALSFVFPQHVHNYLKDHCTNTQILENDFTWVNKNISFDKFLYKFINKLTKSGKKSIAINHFFSFLYLHKIYNLFFNKNYILGDIISIVSPKFKLVSLKYRGRNRLIPKLVNTDRMISLGIGIFLQAVKARAEKGIMAKMFKELLDIYNLQGNSLKLKDANYKSGIANRSLLFRRPSN